MTAPVWKKHDSGRCPVCRRSGTVCASLVADGLSFATVCAKLGLHRGPDDAEGLPIQAEIKRAIRAAEARELEEAS